MQYEDIVEEIVGKTDLSYDDVKKLIDQKIDSMSGLLTPLGAAALLAKEKGINYDKKEKSVFPKISELVPGLSSVNVVGRISRMFPVRDFVRKDGKSGKVCNIVISDKSGQLRLTFWNEQCSEFVPKLKVGDVLKVIDCTTKEGWQGQLEATVMFKTKVILNPMKESDPRILELPESSEISVSAGSERVTIASLKEDDKSKEVLATLVRFYRLTLFMSCPTCQKTIQSEFECPSCGPISGVKKCVVECGIDDTTEYIRAVFFAQHAEKLLQNPTKEIWSKVEELKTSGLESKEAGILYLTEHCKDVLGQEYILRGSVSTNEFTGLVLKVYDISAPSVVYEIQKMLQSVE